MSCRFLSLSLIYTINSDCSDPIILLIVTDRYGIWVAAHIYRVLLKISNSNLNIDIFNIRNYLENFMRNDNAISNMVLYLKWIPIAVRLKLFAYTNNVKVLILYLFPIQCTIDIQSCMGTGFQLLWGVNYWILQGMQNCS